MGKKEGSQLEGVLVGVEVSEGAEEVGDASSSDVPVGFEFTGRSGWSLGLARAALEVGTETGVVEAPRVVVAMTSWSSSSFSVGSGMSVVFLASMASPHSFKCQSMKVPVCSLTCVSLTMIVHLPTPSSPLPQELVTNLLSQQ